MSKSFICICLSIYFIKLWYLFRKLDWLLIDKELAKQVFFPKMMIRQAKSVEKQQLYSATFNDYFWFQVPHHLEYEETLKVTIFCSFDFAHFPFDSHFCDFQFGLNGNAERSSKLSPTQIKAQKSQTRFGQEPIYFSNSRLPFDMQLSGIEPYSITSSGYNYSHAGMRVYFERNKLGLLIGGFYGPTAIFAALSLISYCISPEIVPGRLGLLVTLYLIASNVYNSLKVPENRGFSYLEIWMTGVQIIILLAIFEYGIALTLLKYYTPNDNIKNFHDKEADIKHFISSLDKLTFFLATALLILFVVFYWIIALY